MFFHPVSSSPSLPRGCPCMSLHCLIREEFQQGHLNIQSALWITSCKFEWLCWWGEEKQKWGRNHNLWPKVISPPQLMKCSAGNWSTTHQGWPTFDMLLCVTLRAEMGHSLPAHVIKCLKSTNLTMLTELRSYRKLCLGENKMTLNLHLTLFFRNTNWKLRKHLL